MNSKELFVRDTTVIRKSDNLFTAEVSENWYWKYSKWWLFNDSCSKSNVGILRT